MASFLPTAEHYHQGYYDVKPFYEQNAVSVIQQPYTLPVIQPQPVYHQPPLFDGCVPAGFYYYQTTAPTVSAAVQTQSIQPVPTVSQDDEGVHHFCGIPLRIPHCAQPFDGRQSDDKLRAESEDSIKQKKRSQPHTKRGRPTKNPVWTLFQRIDEKSVLCSMCGRIVKSACATNMTKHIERHHQDIDDFPRETRCQSVKPTPPGAGSITFPMSDEFAAWSADRKPAKRHRRTKHPVWELFCRAEDGTARCIICQAVVRSPCSSNFMGHLNRHHMDHYQNIYQRWVDNRTMDV